MILIKRIFTVALSLIGSLTAIVLLAMVNWLANTGLSGGQVVLYGLIGGIVMGIFAGYFLINFLIRKARNLILNKVAGSVGRFTFLNRM